MKKTNLILALIALSVTASAQNWSETGDNHTTGKLGIGTSSPNAKLQVLTTGISALFGSDVNAGTLTNSTRKFARIGAPHYLIAEEPMAAFVFDSQSSGNIIWIGGGSNKFNTANEIRFATASTNTNQGSNNLNNVKMIINKSGYVGIGRQPTTFLDLYGGSAGDVILRLEADSDNSGGESDNPRIEMFQDGNLIGAAIGFNEDTPTPANIFQFSMTSPGGLIADALTINPNNGFVGVGTMDAKSKLSVDGQIRATEVKVLTDVNSVPDYVFEPDYELRTLKETKEFITENKHLPEIPSASEIGENGIDLGAMNMKLLKKIEELTLHLIEQNERMERMEKELQALKNE